MSFPEFFDAVPRITLHDPLAELLGAAAGGRIQYGYPDAVRLAGHSCPTVAGAYLMTLRALRQLYPESVPERGGLRVELKGAQAEGTTGVVAAVAGLITGAAGEGGFQGLIGRFSRRNLLQFSMPFDGEMRITRLDSQAWVATSYHSETVPPPPELPALMQAVLADRANETERTEFGRLWQMRVKRILIDHFDDPALVRCIAA